MPATSAVNVGVAEVSPLSTAALPAGLAVNVQAKVSASPLASELALPFSATTAPASTF